MALLSYYIYCLPGPIINCGNPLDPVSGVNNWGIPRKTDEATVALQEIPRRSSRADTALQETLPIASLNEMPLK